MALGLSGKVSMLEETISLLGQIGDRLKYLQPSMNSLLEYLCAGQRFEKLEYLHKCKALVRKGESFPDAWKQGVRDSAKGLGEDEADILASLGDTLGCADLDTQLAAIHYTQELLTVKLEQAREQEKKYGKLYRTIGILSGLAVAIVLV